MSVLDLLEQRIGGSVDAGAQPSHGELRGLESGDAGLGARGAYREVVGRASLDGHVVGVEALHGHGDGEALEAGEGQESC